MNSEGEFLLGFFPNMSKVSSQGISCQGSFPGIYQVGAFQVVISRYSSFTFQDLVGGSLNKFNKGWWFQVQGMFFFTLVIQFDELVSNG